MFGRSSCSRYFEPSNERHVRFECRTFELSEVGRLDLPQVMLSQKEKDTEREALGGAREACDRASKCERSEAREASTTCFACRKSNRVTSLWREASCCFHELVFQRIRRLMKMNYFLCFVSSYDDLTHLPQLLKLKFS